MATRSLIIFAICMAISCSKLPVSGDRKVASAIDGTHFILPDGEDCLEGVGLLLDVGVRLQANDLLEAKKMWGVTKDFEEEISRDDVLREIIEQHALLEEKEKSLIIVAALKKNNPEISHTEIKKLYSELLNSCD